MEHYQPSLFPNLEKVVRVGKRIGEEIVHTLTGPHQFASHGDHLFEHPLDRPLEPVTDWPEMSDMGEYLDREV